MSAANFFQPASAVRNLALQGFIGQPQRGPNFMSQTVVNESPQARQVTTIAVPASPDNSTLYTVTIGGVASTFTTDASATQAELGAGLLAAIRANAGANRQMSSAYAGGTLTLTGVWPGAVTVVTRAGGSGGGVLGAPTNSTSAAAADSVGFGLAVVRKAGNDLRKGFVATVANFTAQVISLTFTGNTASYYTGSVTVNGRLYVWGGVVWTTNLDTTCGLIADAINAVLPVETVIAASVGSAGGVVTLTAEVEGAEFDAEARATGHADAEATKAYTTGPSTATSFARAFLGLSVRRTDVEDTTVAGDTAAYQPNEGVEVMTQGFMWVERDTAETWAAGEGIFVSLASATKGRLYNAAGTDRVWMPRTKLLIDRSESSTTSDGLGYVQAVGA